MADHNSIRYELGTGSIPIKSMPERLRPREEMDRVGVDNVSEVTLLAIILGSGTRGVNVVELATRLLRKYASLRELASAPLEELVKDPFVKGLGPAKARTLMASLEIGRRLSRELDPNPVSIRAPEDAARLLHDHVQKLDKEMFWVLHLDTKNRLKRLPEVVSEGILDASLVHPREVFRNAIRASTSGVVLAHNHPSGDPAPSREDIRMTRQLVQAGAIIDIRVLDHVIIGRSRDASALAYVSLREAGLVDFTGA
ncbi:MAG: DNA repair protein RadC [Verrucomicrobia bacterium]|nr:DNA repair protein RadC [Verrucomicrobiota bacterium]